MSGLAGKILSIDKALFWGGVFLLCSGVFKLYAAPNSYQDEVTIRLKTGNYLYYYNDTQLRDPHQYFTAPYFLWGVQYSNFLQFGQIYDTALFFLHVASAHVKTPILEKNQSARTTVYWLNRTRVEGKYLDYHYGFVSMFTFGSYSRSQITEGGGSQSLHNSWAINSQYSSAYPSFALDFFPKSRLGATLDFWGFESNAVYGWLNFKIRVGITLNQFIIVGSEFFNENNFLYGWRRFLDFSGTLYLQHNYRVNGKLFKTKVGMTYAADHMPIETLLGIKDIWFFEFSMAYAFYKGA